MIVGRPPRGGSRVGGFCATLVLGRSRSRRSEIHVHRCRRALFGGSVSRWNAGHLSRFPQAQVRPPDFTSRQVKRRGSRGGDRVSEFELDWRWTGILMSRDSAMRLRIRGSGEVYAERTPHEGELVASTVTVPVERIRELMSALQQDDFFSIETKYRWDVHATHLGLSVITVTVGSDRHSVAWGRDRFLDGGDLTRSYSVLEKLATAAGLELGMIGPASTSGISAPNRYAHLIGYGASSALLFAALILLLLRFRSRKRRGSIREE